MGLVHRGRPGAGPVARVLLLRRQGGPRRPTGAQAKSRPSRSRGCTTSWRASRSRRVSPSRTCTSCPSMAPNAFATGRDPEHSSIAVTQGLLDMMNRVELEGVIGHEMSHVLDRDILIGTIVATVVGAAVLLSEFATRSWFWGGGRRSDDSGGGDGGGSLAGAVRGRHRPADPGAARRAADQAVRQSATASTWPTRRACC